MSAGTLTLRHVESVREARERFRLDAERTRSMPGTERFVDWCDRHQHLLDDVIAAITPDEIIETHGLRIDVGARTVHYHGEPVHVRPRGFDALVVLAGRPTHVFTKADLLVRVWGGFGAVRTVESTLRQLRQSFVAVGATHLIRTSYSVGYRLADGDS